MEKVKLTREQAEIIEKIKKYHREVGPHIFHNDMSIQVRKEWTESFGVLNELSTEEYSRALYIGYEVENTYEVGDWVKVNWTDMKPTIHQVEKVINSGRIVIDGEMKNKAPGMHIVEPATPEEIEEEKQRRWWKNHHRDVWELKEGDCLISKHDRHSCRVKFVEAVNENSVLLVDGNEDEFYEVHHALSIMKYRYKVFCFADDRKDL